MLKKTIYSLKIVLFLSTALLSPLEAVYAMDNPQSYKEQEGLVRQEEQPLKKLISIDSMRSIFSKKTTKINPGNKGGTSFGNRCALEFLRWIENQAEKPKQIHPRDEEESKDLFFDAFSKKEDETKFEPKAIRLEYGSAKPVELTFDVVTFVKKAGYQTLEDYLTKIPLKSIPTASGKFRVGFLYLFDTNPKDKGYLINFYCTENSLNKYFIIDPQWGNFKSLSTFLSRETGKYLKYLYIGYVKDKNQMISEPSKTPPSKTPKRPRNEKEEFSKIKLKRKKLAATHEMTIRNESEIVIPEILQEPMVMTELEAVVPEIVNQLELLSHPEDEMLKKTTEAEILGEPEDLLTTAEAIYEAEILNESDFTVAKVIQSSEQVFNSQPIYTMPTMQRSVYQNGVMAPQVMEKATFPLTLPLTLPMRVPTPSLHPVMTQTLTTSQQSGTELLLQAHTRLTGSSQESRQNLQSVVPQVEISMQAPQNSEGRVTPYLVQMSEYEQREQTIRELEQKLATLMAHNAKTR